MALQTLLIGRGGRVLDVISWMKAIKLAYFRDNAAFPVSNHDVKIRGVNQSFDLPSILVLRDKKDRCPDDILTLTRKNLLIRDENTCQWCGVKLQPHQATIDHLFPTSRKGTNTWRNVVLSCTRCNNEKGNMTRQEYEKVSGKKLLRQPFKPDRTILFKHYLKQEDYSGWGSYLNR